METDKLWDILITEYKTVPLNYQMIIYSRLKFGEDYPFLRDEVINVSSKSQQVAFDKFISNIKKRLNNTKPSPWFSRGQH